MKTPGQNRQTVMDLEQELGSHENCASLTESDGAYTLEFLLPVDGLDGIRAHYDRRSGKAVALRRILTKLEGMP